MGSLLKPPNRDFVMVTEGLWREFHRQWRDIDRQWRGAKMEEDSIGIFPVIQAARDELRAEVRKLAPLYGGPYLIPV